MGWYRIRCTFRYKQIWRKNLSGGRTKLGPASEAEPTALAKRHSDHHSQRCEGFSL